MTKELEKVWRSLSKPFHDDTIYTEYLVRITVLQPFVNSNVQHFNLYYVNNSLFLFDGWRTYDGFINSATPVPIGELA